MKKVVGVNERGLRVGEDHQHARLTDAECELIRQLHEQGMSYKKLADKFGVGKSTIADRLLEITRTVAARDMQEQLLDGMDLEETAGYLRHHLALVGRSDPLFSDDAIALIHQTARGLPHQESKWHVRCRGEPRCDGSARLVAGLGDLRGLDAHVAGRTTVYDDWGFRRRMNRGLSVTTLFHGESGTGKTMAAAAKAASAHSWKPERISFFLPG